MTYTSSTVVAVLASAALLPAVILMIYVYRLDRVEKEPGGLLLKLLFGGILAVLCSAVLEHFFVPNTDAEGIRVSEILFAAFLVGLIEEGSKYFFLKLFSWKNKAFNYRFDGIVYAVFVSLGFAAVENLMYVFSEGTLSVAFSRAVLSIPGHMSFAVYMGIYYGRAKLKYDMGDKISSSALLLTGLLMAILFHFVYDATLMVGSEESMLIFVLVVIFIYGSVFYRIKREAASDQAV